MTLLSGFERFRDVGLGFVFLFLSIDASLASRHLVLARAQLVAIESRLVEHRDGLADRGELGGARRDEASESLIQLSSSASESLRVSSRRVGFLNGVASLRLILVSVRPFCAPIAQRRFGSEVGSFWRLGLRGSWSV